MTKTVTFAGEAYAQTQTPGPISSPAPTYLDTLSGPRLLTIYNLVSANLGRGRVKRFADTEAALRRTWAILEEYDAQGPAGAAPKAETPQKAAAAPKADKPKAEPAPKAATAPAGERWRTPKRRDPSKRCYMPRPGSKQDVAYKLLTAEGGIRVEDLCTEMSKLDKVGKNSTEWKEPGTIWGSLNYLFVTQKGYGLDFDGERIRLLIGKEEVPFSTTKKA